MKVGVVAKNSFFKVNHSYSTTKGFKYKNVNPTFFNFNIYYTTSLKNLKVSVSCSAKMWFKSYEMPHTCTSWGGVSTSRMSTRWQCKFCWRVRFITASCCNAIYSHASWKLVKQNEIHPLILQMIKLWFYCEKAAWRMVLFETKHTKFTKSHSRLS